MTSGHSADEEIKIFTFSTPTRNQLNDDSTENLDIYIPNVY